MIRQPRGNMLLRGIGGSGRQSLSKLASYICEYTVFQIEVSKNYKKLEFREGMAFKNNLKTCFCPIACLYKLVERCNSTWKIGPIPSIVAKTMKKTSTYWIKKIQFIWFF